MPKGRELAAGLARFLKMPLHGKKFEARAEVTELQKSVREVQEPANEQAVDAREAAVPVAAPAMDDCIQEAHAKVVRKSAQQADVPQEVSMPKAKRTPLDAAPAEQHKSHKGDRPRTSEAKVDADEVRPCATDLVQFDSAIYYVDEDSGELMVDVNRVGMQQGTCRVDYATVDGSAKAGRRYEEVKGTLEFQEGELVKTIAVRVLDNDYWSATQEFAIQLSNPVNCTLSPYLYLSRVKVLDKDMFPTNRFQDELATHGPENFIGEAPISGASLLVEFFTMIFKYEGMRVRSLQCLAVDQLGNLNYLLTTYLIQYVVDEVVGSKDFSALLVPGSANDTLQIIAFAYIAPYALVNLLGVWKASRQTAEVARRQLQENMFNRFMCYDMDVRQKVNMNDLNLIMIDDIFGIVDSGYMQVFEVCRCLGRIAVSSYFIQSENPEALQGVIIFALSISAFVTLNYEKSVEANEQVNTQQAAMMDVVQESNIKYRLIADYQIRDEMGTVFQKSVRDLNKATYPRFLNRTVNNYVPGWVSNFLIAVYLVLGSQAVIRGEVQTGTFLATINVFQNLGDSFKELFDATLDVARAIAPVQKLTEFMNLPTQLEKEQSCVEFRRFRTREMMTPEKMRILRKRNPALRVGRDVLPITLRRVSLAYDGRTDILAGITQAAPQGELIGVIGERSSGKSTLMKILGQVLFPTAGEVFVPSHLRVLHVSEDPEMFDGSLWRNLALGSFSWTDPKAETDRAIRICERIGLSEEVMQELKETRDDFMARLSRPVADMDDFFEEATRERSNRQYAKSDCILIHLARAFIFNPEVLVMMRPARQLPTALAKTVHKMIREFVDKRGLELPCDDEENYKVERRPRTAFISFSKMSGVRLADRIWLLENRKIKNIPIKDVDPSLLS